MPDLPRRFGDFVAEHELIAAGEQVIVGVSGGVDSVVLWHLLAELCQPLAVHVHHGLREDADTDAEFVEKLGRDYDRPVLVRRVTVPEGASRQAQARRARYEALEVVAAEEGIASVAVAHQRDDVAETLLLQLLRGAGPRGWAAPPLRRPILKGSAVSLIRPLRFVGRREIEAFARAEGLTWRDDPSNAALRYRRAVIRKRVAPILRKYFGDGVMDRIAAAAELAEAYRESGAPLDAADALAAVCDPNRGLRVDALRDLPEVLRKGVILEAIAAFDPEAPRSASAAAAALSLLDAQPGRRIEMGPITVWRERDVLTLTKPHQPLHFAGTLSIPGSITTPWGRVSAEVLDGIPPSQSSDSNREVIDADRIGDALFVRTWKAGDSFVPLGMTGRKRISDLLTDRHVPSSERDRQLVLTDRDRIIWAVGHRLAADVRLRPETRRAVLLRWHPNIA